MPVFLISFDLGSNQASENRAFYNVIEGMGEPCKISSTTVIVDAEIEINDLIDALSGSMDDDKTLFVIDLETLEVDGLNLPNCIEEFVSSPEDSYLEDEDSMDD